MMILLYLLHLWWQRLRQLLLGPIRQSHGRHRRKQASPLGRVPKPEWVARRVIRLKALMPEAGCRQIADIFNRIHGARRGTTIGKTFVADLVRAHEREIAELRRELRRRHPRPCRRNAVWALDLTGKRDQSGQVDMILGLIDHGTRLALMLRTVRCANSWTMLGYVCLAIGRWGKPTALRTDNAAIFTSRLFRSTLARLGIRHQRSAVGCPWQNGRIERLFGTLKSKLDRWPVASAQELERSLALFAYWYNAIRPHRSLGGRTPEEAWHGIDPQAKPTRAALWFSAWHGLLTGYSIRR